MFLLRPASGFIVACCFSINLAQNLPVPPLPYAYDALEPYIDEATVRVHHLGHHASYTAQLNVALSELRKDSNTKHLAKLGIDELLHHVNEVPAPYIHTIRQAGGGYVNHGLFWQCMSPYGGIEPTADSALIQERRFVAAVEKVFGSIETLKQGFSTAAGLLFGSGWTFLYYDKQRQSLEITNTSGHDSPAFSAYNVPLLTLDMWEHAYYLKHQNNKKDYIHNFFSVVDWKSVATRYVLATGEVKPEPLPSLQQQEKQRVGLMEVDQHRELMVE